jgi:DNA processing protein
MNTHDFDAWLRLSLTPSVGNDTARLLLKSFGSAAAIFEQSASSLSAVVSLKQTQALLVTPQDFTIQRERTRHWLVDSPTDVSRAIWTLGDHAYPNALLSLSHPPLMLYAQGQLNAAQPPMLSIVGSRNPTAQGAQIARDLARSLVDHGLCVVSGMALGIDGAAHLGALSSSPRSAASWHTVAVVGTGLDRVYPRQHHTLAHDICQRGAMISEFHLGQGPMAHHFPMRNRLIAALGLATLVVEAAPESGSLITADLALELGREVMAVPGSIYSTHAKGCHQLLRQGAKLIETVNDIMEELPGIVLPSPHADTGSPQLAQHTNDPLLLVMGFSPVTLDELQCRSGMPTAQLQTQLLTLELSGSIGRMPGGLFQRLRNV